MITVTRYWMAFLVSLLTAACCGCGSQPADTVHGLVNLNGKPLVGARVHFVPSDADTIGGATATTGKDGLFSIVPDEGMPPLKPAKYVVVISRKVDKQGKVPGIDDFGQLEAAGMLKETLPARYSSPQNSELSAEITSGKTVLEPFNLKGT